MPRKNKILFVAATLLLTALAAWLLLRPTPEPSYNGKTVSQWLEQYRQLTLIRDRQERADATERRNEAANAIAAIGSNAVPTLIKLIATRDSSFKRFLTNHVSQTAADRLRFGDYWRRYCSASVELPERGRLGFITVGSNGCDAVSGLIKVIQTSDNPNGRRAAINSLAVIGPKARAALPQLLICLGDTDIDTQFCAYDVIGQIIYAAGPNDRRWAADLLLTPLIDTIKNPKADPYCSIVILGWIGPEASPAAPVLATLMSSTNISPFMVMIVAMPTGDSTIGAAACRTLERIGSTAIK